MNEKRVDNESEKMEAHRQKRADHHPHLSAEILSILNDPLDLPDTISRILHAVKRETGFDAVGIRLRSGDDFPYFVQDGFSNDFLLTENTLVARAKDGSACRDKNGNVRLECTCGLVLSGQTNPTDPLFTSGGSCWTNNSLPVLNLPADQDPRDNPRNRCIHEGYCSVALIPVRAKREIVGLLQLNDRKKDCFTLEMIHFFEGISASIGVALKRKQAEEALRESEERLRLSLMATDQGLYDLNIQTGKTIVSPEYARMLGYEPHELVETKAKLLDRLHPDDRDRVHRIYEECLSGVRDVYRVEFRQKTKSGDWKWMLSLGSVVERDKEGHPLRMLGTHTDITERKLAETQKAELEAQNRQLQKAESLGRMAGAIAHHFNNQLQIVSGCLELASIDMSLNAGLVKNLSRASEATRRAAEVSGLMLTYLGQTTATQEPLDICSVCRRILPLLRAMLPERIILEAHLPSPGSVVRANEDELQQILTNLVTNAREAVGDGRGAIHVTVRSVSAVDIPVAHRFPIDRQPRDDTYACLEVTDPGCGITDKDIEKIFDPFFTKKFPGRGMGLAVVLGIVRAYRGLITVESKPGQGSIFRVFFPVFTAGLAANTTRIDGEHFHGRT